MGITWLVPTTAHPWEVSCGALKAVCLHAQEYSEYHALSIGSPAPISEYWGNSSIMNTWQPVKLIYRCLFIPVCEIWQVLSRLISVKGDESHESVFIIIRTHWFRVIPSCRYDACFFGRVNYWLAIKTNYVRVYHQVKVLYHRRTRCAFMTVSGFGVLGNVIF